jgi:hypothetical protein
MKWILLTLMLVASTAIAQDCNLPPNWNEPEGLPCSDDPNVYCAGTPSEPNLTFEHELKVGEQWDTVRYIGDEWGSMFDPNGVYYAYYIVPEGLSMEALIMPVDCNVFAYECPDLAVCGSVNISFKPRGKGTYVAQWVAYDATGNRRYGMDIWVVKTGRDARPPRIQ